MAETEREVQAFTAKLAKMVTDIPISLSIGDAATQIDDFTKSISRDPVKLYVGLNTVAADAQFDLMVERMTKSPIQVPVTFVPTNGLPGIAPIAPAGATMTGAGGGSFLPAASTSRPLFGPGTTFTPATTIAPPAPYSNTMQGAAAAAAAAATAGGAMAAEGGGEFFNMRALRKVMGGMMVAEAGWHTAAGLIDAGRAYMTDDNAENAKLIEAGQHSIQRFPVVGDLIESAGEGIERGISAGTNYFERGKGKGRFESDLAYGERVTEEAKAQDERTKEIRRGAEIVKRANDQMEAQILTNDRGAATDGIVGTFDRARKLDDVRRDQLEEKLKDPQYRRRDGTLTDTAARYRASELAKLGADASRRNVAEGEVNSEDAGALTVARRENAGDFAGMRRAQFDQAIKKQTAAAYKVSQAHGDYFANTLAPVLGETFDADEKRRTQAGNYELDNSREGSRVRIAVAGLQMMHREDLAGEMATINAIDQRVEKLRQAAALEQDAAKKARLQLEAGYTESAADAEKKAVRQRVEEERSQRLRGPTLTAAEIGYRAEGRPDMAAERGIVGRVAMDVARSTGDPTMQLAQLNVGRAQLAEFIHGQDHPAVFNSMSGWSSHVQESVLEHDPDAMRDARKTLDEWNKAAEKMSAAAEKIMNSKELYTIPSF